jgi:hypothetical protein
LSAEWERERSGSRLGAAIEGDSVRVAAPGGFIARVAEENCFVAGSRAICYDVSNIENNRVQVDLLTVGTQVWAVLIIPVPVRARMALIVVFLLEVTEAVREALPVERTAGAALGGTGAVVRRGVAIRIVASLRLDLEAARQEGDEEGGRQWESDCERG